MPGPRRLLLLGAALVLLLLTACGNDPVTPSGDASEPPAQSSEPAPTEHATASEGPSELTTSVTLGQLCEEEYAGVEAPEGFTVRLVTDGGRIDDGTFNQSGYEGMQAAADCFGFETDFIETQNQADFTNNLETVLADDPDVVVTIGFLLKDTTLEFAKDNPDVTFIGVDQFHEKFPDNYVGVQFREDQGGFLAGTMAALLTESEVIGVVGGQQSVPPVVRLVNAYRKGAEYMGDQIGKDIRVLHTFNSTFFDRAKGRSDAEQFMGEGADVVFNAGGETGAGGIQAATEAGKWGIGVDQDEYFTTFQGGDATGVEMLATSAIKRVDLGVFENLAAAVEDQFTSGVFTLEAANDGITYAPFHEADIPADVAAKLEEVRQGLADGSIGTGVDPVTGEPTEGAS